MAKHLYYNPDRKRWELIDPNRPEQATVMDRPPLPEGFTVHFEEDPRKWMEEYNKLEQKGQ